MHYKFEMEILHDINDMNINDKTMTKLLSTIHININNKTMTKLLSTIHINIILILLVHIMKLV